MRGISTFLWFDDRAQEAAEFYVSLFPRSQITGVSHYPEAGPGPTGGVMTVSFELDGRPFTALNGGPVFTFTEAVSFVISCEDQAEVDHYWHALGDGGVPGQCGWLKDRYGLSWQVVPVQLYEVLGGDDPAGVERATAAMLAMGRLDIAALRAAYAGEESDG